MKKNSKYIAVLGMLGVMLALVSCGGTDNSTATNTSVVLEYTGVLQRVVKTDVPSPYFFVNDDSAVEDYYLESSTINLDKFLNEEIVIRGYVKDAATQLFFITDAWNKDDMLDDAASQSIYSDVSFGLKFSYPSAWRVTKKDSGKLELYIREKDEPVAEMYRVELTGKTTMDSWIDKNYPGDDLLAVVIGTIAGSEVVGKDVTIFQSDATLFQIKKNYAGDDVTTVNKEYSTMLSSLRVFSIDNFNESEENSNESSFSSDSSSTSSSSNDNKSTSGSSTSSQNDTQSSSSGATSKTASVGSSAGNSSTTQKSIRSPDVVAAISARGDLLTSEKTPVISQVEVAAGNYVYVTYMDGAVKKKALFQYSSSGNGFDFSQVGEFQQGTSTTWEKVSGNNAAFDKAREVYDVSSGEVKKKTTVSKGQSVYTNTQLDFNVEYPRNWYYAGENISAQGGMQKVTFSDAPLGDEPTRKVEIEVYGKGHIDTSAGTKTTVGGKDAYVLTGEDGTQKYVIEGSDGKTYVTSSTGDAESTKALESAIKTLDK